MRALDGGELPPDDPSLVEHLDRCLGCRGCEPVCPSGVAYGAALEAARERIAAVRRVPALARLVLRVMAWPEVRRPLLAVARLLRPVLAPLAGRGPLGFAAGMVAASRPVGRLRGWAVGAVDRSSAGVRPLDPVSAAQPLNRSTTVFQGCIQSGLFSHVNDAAARTLAANGYRLVTVPEQGCCGALHAHAGLLVEARALARANVAAFAREPDAAVAVTAAGCGAMLRSYGDLLAHDPAAPAAQALAARVRDVTELLHERGPRPGGQVAARVAYDPPCHLLHAQRVADAPRAVLAAVPGLELVEHAEAELCCGSAGIFTLLQRELALSVLDRKVAALAAAAPDLVASGNPGCAMQIGAGLRASHHPARVAHPVELLDWSYRAAGYYAP
jgi:glycolate oxidase iron-sulfur subunit